VVEYYLSPSVVYLGDFSTENIAFPTESEWVAVVQHTLCRTSHKVQRIMSY